MPTALELLNQLCERCNADFPAQFDVTPRPAEDVIAGDRVVNACCFVRDSIRFLNNGRLIFAPEKDREGRYCQNYFVVCRKLTIVGGRKPGDPTPCGPDEPGTNYSGNNVITWLGRLAAAATGATKSQGAAGTDNGGAVGDPHGPAGGNGADGEAGNPGGNGQSAPGSLTIVALEVEVIGASHLTIDWDGQTGGRGGPGQRGGDGGDGGRGADGQTESSWGSESCSRGAGNGGNGGNGGRGGNGGNGGRGGNAGPIYVISTIDQISGSGAFVGGDITYVNDGGSGGNGGSASNGGSGGEPGDGGSRNSPCDAGDRGERGTAGVASSTDGSAGGAGGGAVVEYKKIEPQACANKLPLPVVFTAVSPSTLTRGFSTPEDVDTTLIGQNLSQVTQVTTSLAGVTADIRPGSTDTQLELRFSLTGTSAVGLGNLGFERAFGPANSAPGAITVQKFEVTAVSPASFARNNSVAITISGTGFDAAAAVQTVNVSGPGVNVVNVAVTSSTTITCVFEIGAAAQQTARNVTVNTGGMTHTLVGGFTVT